MKPLVGYEWPEGRSKQVVYISQDHHIHELVVGIGGEWQHADLMTLAGAPRASSRFLVGYAWPEGGTKQVAYLGPDDHIQELSVHAGGTWQHVDLNAITGAPPAVQVTAGYSWVVGRSKQVVFVGDDDHIHELVVEMDKPWRHVDLTAMTNAPRPASKYMVGYEWALGQSKQVAYVGQDGHIHELSVEAGGTWQQANLTELAQAPITPITSIDGYAWSTDGSKKVAYVGDDGEVRELWMPRGGTWAYADLS